MVLNSITRRVVFTAAMHCATDVEAWTRRILGWARFNAVEAEVEPNA